MPENETIEAPTQHSQHVLSVALECRHAPLGTKQLHVRNMKMDVCLKPSLYSKPTLHASFPDQGSSDGITTLSEDSATSPPPELPPDAT